MIVNKLSQAGGGSLDPRKLVIELAVADAELKHEDKTGQSYATDPHKRADVREKVGKLYEDKAQTQIRRRGTPSSRRTVGKPGKKKGPVSR